MNYLAHIYLSFGDPQLSLGNFIADRVRGKDYLNYPKRVQQGILLHRAIDTFTDSHTIPRVSSKRLHPRYHHYSGVIVDIYYDHFLARLWAEYSEVPLEDYTHNFYTLLKDNLDWLPRAIQHMSAYMIADNWLLNYRELEGLERVFQGMNRRTSMKSGMDTAVEELELHYSDFEAEFRPFFEDLIIFSREKLLLLKT
ncbi:ACP phosphodiesterase [Robiginitalea sp.]|uniref:acyl carrier protein phosphodiesterase n=1 Tax=Robiginitalea sp. TaxID=1902411 RepID=UPI003C75706D